MATALEVIQEHPTWAIHDSSKLSTFSACPRKYFFTYILGWHSATPNNHLVFGSAWHLALEHLYRTGMDDSNVLAAAFVFTDHYRRVFPASTDELFSPKTPANAALRLRDYAERYARELDEERVLYTELGGVVLVAKDRTMAFKCDVILEDHAYNIRAKDYKTSKYYRSDWGDQWTLSMQMNTYLHALHCLRPDQAEHSITVESAFFHEEPKRAPRVPRTLLADHTVTKTPAQMNAWLVRVNAWLDAMDYNMDVLRNEDTTDAPAMASFPMNDNACFSYGRRCAFFDFCNAWPNPLARCDEVPLGFQVEWWNPLAVPELRQVVDLTQEDTRPCS